ncbi:ABC transporter permease [Leifsonia kafniensis]|uniref:Autoinducer 2 import system permease protein LsrD n=1 Tax=Leifsonia kafniensis TaxID=475957 RepID=A0ABP7KSK9_9MICO
MADGEAAPAITTTVYQSTSRRSGGEKFRDGVSRVFRNYSILILAAMLFVVFSILRPETFPTLANLQGIALGQAVGALLALAVLLVAVTGEFDLSPGYILGFSAMLVAVLCVAGVPAPLAIIVGLVAGGIFGFASGFLVAKLGFNSLIATLGIGLAISGLTAGISGGQTIATGIPQIIFQIARFPILGFPMSVWIVLVAAIAMYIVLAKTSAGRKIYATGGNERVARMVGIRTGQLKIVMFILAGVVAALAGVLQLGLSGAANPGFGSNLLLPAFAAVFLGSTTVRPGFFNVWGTMSAVLLLAVGFSGLSLLGVPFWTQPVFSGVALIVGVLLSRWTKTHKS